MDYQYDLISSFAFKSPRKESIIKFENQNVSQQKLLNEMNVHFNNQPKRIMNFHKDILKYFDNEYQFHNEQQDLAKSMQQKNHFKKKHLKNEMEERKNYKTQKSKSLSQGDENLVQSIIELESISKLEVQKQGSGSAKKTGQKFLKSKTLQIEKEEQIDSLQSNHLEEKEIAQEHSHNKSQDQFWKYFKLTTDKLVKHQNLSKDYNIYHPTEIDLDNIYIHDQISHIQGWKLDIQNRKENTHNIESRQCSQFYENKHTGDKFISQCCFDEILKDKQHPTCVVSAKFWKFDFKKQIFEVKAQVLLDVFYSIERVFMLNQKIFSLNENQYYFTKNYFRKNEKAFVKQFQLNCLKLKSRSNYEFLNNGKIQNQKDYDHSILSKYNIDLPDDWQHDLKELDICFLIDSNQKIISGKNINFIEILQDQYVLIKTVVKKEQNVKQNKKAFLIYSLNNLKFPLVRFEDNEFEDIIVAFNTWIDDNLVIFTLKSQHTVYEITCNIKKGTVKKSNDNDYKILKDSRIQIQVQKEDDKLEEQNLMCTLLTPLQMEVKLGKQFNEESFTQSYFVESNGCIKLIYPFHFEKQVVHDDHHTHVVDHEKDANHKQDAVKLFIKQKSGLMQNLKLGIIFFTFNNLVEVNYISNELIHYLETQGKPKNVDTNKIYCSKDIMVSFSQNGLIHSYSIKNSRMQNSFTEELNQLCGKNQNRKILNCILKNFEFQENYENHCHNDLTKKQYQHQYDIHDTYYLNRNKKGVYQTHNKVFIDQKEYKFDERYLLIDMNFSNSNKNEDFKMLLIFSDDIQDLHLTKFYTSQSCAIFFMKHTARKMINEDNELVDVDEDDQIGIEFFVIKTYSQLQLMILQNQPLIHKESQIYIPYSLNKISKEKYGDQMSFKKFLNHQKKMDITTHKITFESIVDQNNPAIEWIQFIFHEKIANSMYEHYICFMNIEEIGEKLMYEDQDDENDQIQFSNFIQVFKIEYYQDEDEPHSFKECLKKQFIYRNSNHSAKIGGISLFSRSSNWQIVSSNESEQYLVRFQLGINLIFDELQCVEIQEFLFTIDNSNLSFFNVDQKYFSSIQLKEKENNFKVYIVPIQQRFLLKSQLYKQYQKQKNMQFFDKERLFPVINDDGNIDGCIALLNQSQTHEGIYQISDDISIIEKYCAKEQIKILQERLGQYVYIKKKQKDHFHGFFSDGYLMINIKYQVTNLFKQKCDFLISNNIEVDEDKIKLEMFNKTHQTYFYNIIELSDQYNQDDILQPIFGPFTRQTIKRLSFNNQMNNQVFMCSTILNKQTINLQCFDKNESIYWLYFFSKYLICMSLPNFNEILLEHNTKRIERYFQPRYLFLGKSFVYSDFQYNPTSIHNLREAFIQDFENEKMYTFVENSPIYFSLMGDQISSKHNIIVQCFYLGKYHGLQYDYLRYESIVQKALDQNKLKAVSFIIEYLLKHCEEQQLISVLSQDLPQLFGSSKVNINDYLNVSFREELDIESSQNFLDQDQKKKKKLFLMNWEQVLAHDELIIFGPDENIVKPFSTFEGPFQTQDQICQFLLKEQKESQIETEKKEEENLIEEEDQKEGMVQIQYSYINFAPMIRKMKIDKILERDASDAHGTQYLELINQEFKDISYVDDLLISTIINHGAEMNPEVIEQSSVKRIVELQFMRVKPIIERHLLIYIFFFVFPFIYNIYIVDINHDNPNANINFVIIKINYLIGLCTQILFMVFEYADIKYNGLQAYFSDGWNLLDFSQFIFYQIHVWIRLSYQRIKFHDAFKLFDCILQILMVLQCSIKMLQFLKCYDDFCFLVQMITQVFVDLIPFMTIFTMFVLMFVMVTVIMEADFPDDGYENVPKILRIFIQTFRNSIGDIQSYNYGPWNNIKNEEGIEFARPIAIFIIWLFWFLNVLAMLIILINFLISQVSQTYSKVLDMGGNFLYLQKAELNQHVFQIENLFGHKNHFNALIFQQPKIESQTQSDQLATIVENIKKYSDQTTQMKQDIVQLVNQNSEKINQKIQDSKELFIEQIDEVHHQMNYSIKMFEDFSANITQQFTVSMEQLLKEKKEDKEMMNQLNQKLDFLTGMNSNSQFISHYEEIPQKSLKAKSNQEGVNQVSENKPDDAQIYQTPQANSDPNSNSQQQKQQKDHFKKKMNIQSLLQIQAKQQINKNENSENQLQIQNQKMSDFSFKNNSRLKIQIEDDEILNLLNQMNQVEQNQQMKSSDKKSDDVKNLQSNRQKIFEQSPKSFKIFQEEFLNNNDQHSSSEAEFQETQQISESILKNQEFLKEIAQSKTHFEKNQKLSITFRDYEKIQIDEKIVKKNKKSV